MMAEISEFNPEILCQRFRTLRVGHGSGGPARYRPAFPFYSWHSESLRQLFSRAQLVAVPIRLRAPEPWMCPPDSGSASPQKVDILFADHSPIHHPDPVGVSFFFHCGDDNLNRRHVGTVSRKDFIAQRESFGSADRPNADLFATGPVVARVSPRRVPIRAANQTRR